MSVFECVCTLNEVTSLGVTSLVPQSHTLAKPIVPGMGNPFCIVGQGSLRNPQMIEVIAIAIGCLPELTL